MANEGILANAAVTGFAAGAFLHLAWEVHRRRRAHPDGRMLAGLLFFAVVGVHLLFAALRQVVAFVGQADAGIASLEIPLFYAAAIPAAFAIVPISYMAAYALTGRDAVALNAAAIFTAIVSIGLFFVGYEGIEGPLVGYWGTEWTIRSLVAKAILLVFMTLPAFVAGVILILAGRRAEGAGARRVRLVGITILLYYGAFTLDALGEPNVWLLAERAVMALAALVGYRAYAASGIGAGTTHAAAQ